MKPSVEEAERRRAERFQQAQERLARMTEAEGFQTWLRLRAGLHRFSWRNQVLIALQCAERGIEPRMVQSATRWKREGFHPKKGSQALWVWAFRSRRGKPKPGTRLGWWTCCGVKQLQQTKCASCGRADHYFTLAPEFDASQVISFEDGRQPPRPPNPSPIEGHDKVEQLRDLVRWAHHAPEDVPAISVAILRPDEDHHLADGVQGYCRTDGEDIRHIVVNAQLSLNHQLAVLVHELAHAIGVSSKADDDLSYAEAEVCAECVAFLVCDTIGLDTSGQALPYMAQWQGAHLDVLGRRVQLINEAASKLEAALTPKETPVADAIPA